jgi:hypothetical protein
VGVRGSVFFFLFCVEIFSSVGCGKEGRKEGRKEAVVAFMSYYPGTCQEGRRETTENPYLAFQYINVSQRCNSFMFSLVIGTCASENCIYRAQMRPYQFFSPCLRICRFSLPVNTRSGYGEAFV